MGLEHLLLSEGAADSVLLAFDDEEGPFRLTYRLRWNESWQLRDVELQLETGWFTKSLNLQTDGHGHCRQADGRDLHELDGCFDLDIWPTPFTNTFPIHRVPLSIGERREFRMAWVLGTAMTVHPQSQAYTRVSDRTYLFENLDGSGFRVELPVDDEGLVLDYPDHFQRVAPE